MLKLDVGCGDLPKGDVNIDLFTGISPHFYNKPRFIKVSTIPNFIKADCNCLPFRDNVFDESVARHLIEHKGVKPIRTIKEMLRVTKGKVRIIVPHRYAETIGKLVKWDMHQTSFNLKSLTKLLRRMGLAFEIKVKYQGFPFRYVYILRIPIEMEAIIQAGA